MIDFHNAKFVKLKPVSDLTFSELIAPMCVPSEQIIQSFKGMRDGVVFTTKRIIVINIQGVTGKKKAFTTLPYSKIQAMGVETAGVLDLDSELELWFSGLGKVKFEFVSEANILYICQIISAYLL